MLVGRLRAQHDALRVAEVHDDGVDGFVGDHQRRLPEIGGKAHGRAKRWMAGRSVDLRDTFDAGDGFDVDDAVGAIVATQQERGQSAYTVSRHLGMAAVGVVQTHRCACVRVTEHDQAVGADSGMPVAHLTREGAQRATLDVTFLHVEEVVAVGVGFGEFHRGDRGRNRRPRK